MAVASGYTTPLRWEGVPRSELRARVSHDVRDTEKESGRRVNHSNPNINQFLTQFNETWVPDENGGRKRLGGKTPIDDVVNFIDERTALAKTWHYEKKWDKYREVKKLRKNTSVAMEVIFMLDPEFTGPAWSMFHETFEQGAKEYLENETEPLAQMIRDGKFDKYVGANFRNEAADLLIKEAQENVDKWRETIDERYEKTIELLSICADYGESMFNDGNWAMTSLHVDEGHFHIQIIGSALGEGVTHPDGRYERRIGSREFHGVNEYEPGKRRTEAQARYSKKHDEVRERLRAAGYDATFERVDNMRPNLPKEQLTVLKLQEKMIALGDRFREKQDQEQFRTELEQLNAAEALRVGEKNLNAELKQLPALRKRAQEEGKREGLEAAEKEAAKLRAEAEQVKTEAEKDRAAARIANAEADEAKEAAEQDYQAAQQAKRTAEQDRTAAAQERTAAEQANAAAEQAEARARASLEAIQDLADAVNVDDMDEAIILSMNNLEYQYLKEKGLEGDFAAYRQQAIRREVAREKAKDPLAKDGLLLRLAESRAKLTVGEQREAQWRKMQSIAASSAPESRARQLAELIRQQKAQHHSPTGGANQSNMGDLGE